MFSPGATLLSNQMASSNQLMFVSPAHLTGRKHHVLPQGHCPVLRNDKRKTSHYCLSTCYPFFQTASESLLGKAVPGCSGEGTVMGSAIPLLLQGPNTPLPLQPQPGRLFH